LGSCSGLYLNWLSSNIEDTSFIILPKWHLSFDRRSVWRPFIFNRRVVQIGLVWHQFDSLGGILCV
jgi:hypothetical protein